MKSLKSIITLIAIAMTSVVFAQDGEGLFKAKCNACHMLGKDGTGPNLQGVKQKWEDAGEAEYLYRWVQNPDELIQSGESELAIAAEGYSEIAMTAQDVTNEDIDAIFEYIDNYVAPAEEEPVADTGSTAEEVEVVYVTNYRKNLTKFYFLLFAVFIQLIAILILSSSSKSLVRIQEYKIKKDASKGMKTILALIGVFGAMAATSSSYALEFVKAGENPDMPWLLVEDTDIYFMIVVNVVLLLLVFHFRRLFLEISAMVRPQAAEKKLTKRQQRQMNKVLTDAVPIEEEHTILLHHEYDGIKELDNNLPPWWVWMFYATIAFSIVYIFNYHILKTGDSQAVEYDKSIAAAEAEVSEYLDKMAMNVDENNVTLLTDDGAISTGKALFETNCITCHGMNGEGNQIGPNLTDKSWIYGYDIAEVFTSVKYGRSNGMPEHNSKLNPIQLQQVSSFVLSLPETDGREAQGDIVEE